MKNIVTIILAAAVFTFTACGTESIETSDNFEQVVLPDSSVVYLNHNSKISYDENFNPRKVTLEGEAFFSINDGETPFTVETTSGEEAIVKGTEFFMAATSVGAIVEVESGLVALQISTGVVKEVHIGERCEFHHHDNGLHLGHAKHAHRHWISTMEADFRTSGIFLLRSRKHAGSGFYPGHPGLSAGYGKRGGPGNKPEKGGPGEKGKPDGKGRNDGKGDAIDGKGDNDRKGGGNDAKGGANDRKEVDNAKGGNYGKGDGKDAKDRNDGKGPGNDGKGGKGKH